MKIQDMPLRTPFKFVSNAQGFKGVNKMFVYEKVSDTHIQTCEVVNPQQYKTDQFRDWNVRKVRRP